MFKYLDKILFNKDTSIRTVLDKFGDTGVYTEGRGFAYKERELENCLVEATFLK